MALNQRKSTRWMARVGTWIARVASLVIIGLKAALNFKAQDGLMVKGEKTANFALRRGIYLIADYGLWGLSVALFTTMKALGFPLLVIFIALWLFDFLAAGAFVLFYEKTGEDLSLGEDFRRARDAVDQKSRMAGYSVLLLFVVQSIVWTGPEKVITFFRKEIGDAQVVSVLLALTGIQASIWVVLYNLGYGLVVEFF